MDLGLRDYRNCAYQRQPTRGSDSFAAITRAKHFKEETDVEGYNLKGFKPFHSFTDDIYKHRNGTLFDDEGYDYYGYDNQGFNRENINRIGINRKGFDVYTKRHINGTFFDSEGLNYLGFTLEQEYSWNKRKHLIFAFESKFKTYRSIH
jgi:hypothetical protein